MGIEELLAKAIAAEMRSQQEELLGQVINRLEELQQTVNQLSADVKAVTKPIGGRPEDPAPMPPIDQTPPVDEESENPPPPTTDSPVEIPTEGLPETEEPKVPPVVTPPPTQNPDKPTTPETPVSEVPNPDPVVDEEDEPTIPSAPAGTYVIAINDFSDPNIWNRGVYRGKTGVSVPGGADNLSVLKSGREVVLGDGIRRKIVWPQEVGQHISLFLDGPEIDPSKCGAPNKVTVILDGSIPTPIPSPDKPADADDDKDDTPELEVTPTPSPLPSQGNLPLAGMNLAGMGNNPWLDAINGPDGTRAGTHYRTPKEKTLAPYVKHLNGKPWLGRLVISGERLVIDTNKLTFSEKYMGEIIEAMDLVHKFGGKILLDMHNYFRWWKKVPAPIAGRQNRTHNDHLAKGTAVWTVIGEPDCPITVEKWCQIWQNLAKRLMNHPAMLIYGLMNEPHNNGADGVNINAKWPPAAQKAVEYIRQVDKERWISVAGNFYSSAKLWTRLSAELAKVKDPSNRLVFEAHQYMDQKGDGGGRWTSQSDPVAADQGTKDWAAWVQWLKANNLKGLAGEFGGPATAGQLVTAVDRLMDVFIQHNIPFTQWLSGEGFSDNYANGMNKADGTLKPNSAPLMKRLGATCETYGPGK